ncbi:MAG: hypothetical protein M1815_004249 [Lichina confinis]|nr:MAG: hypothetical protein M1815_004249 [Lichina confinis]
MPRGNPNVVRRDKKRDHGARSKPRVKSNRRILDALAVASKQTQDRTKLPRNRARKLEDGDNDDSIREPDRAQSGGLKRDRANAVDDSLTDEDVEQGSDSEGNEWLLGQAGSQDDSDVDSDEAMGESDGDKFQSFAFRGSNSTAQGPAKKRRLSAPKRQPGPMARKPSETQPHDPSDDDCSSWSGISDEGFEPPLQADTTGRDISDQPGASDEGELSEEAELDSAPGAQHPLSEEETDSTVSASDDEQEPDDDRLKISELHSLINAMDPEATGPRDSAPQGGNAVELDAPTAFGITSSRKLTVEDLLPSVTDATLKKSLKLMAAAKRSKQSDNSKGVPGKLNAPLPKRQQDRLDRGAAYEKSKETLERWTDTIKHNRRAEHLQFPMLGSNGTGAHPGKEALPRSTLGNANELELAVRRILQESGLDPRNGDEKEQEQGIQALEEEHLKQLSVEEARDRRAQLRMARELLFREELRAKRIKKIKSKSFRRIRRKEREKVAGTTHSALSAEGMLDPEEEQERIDRRRAEARMGARHRNSKWAKGVKAAGRQKWDDDARLGIVDLAQRDEQLRKRIEGKPVSHDAGLVSDSSGDDSSDTDSDGDGGQVHGRDKVAARLDRLAKDHPNDASAQPATSGLASMKFMQRAEAARKAENDASVELMRRELAGEDVLSEEGPAFVGRRRFQPQPAHRTAKDRPTKPKGNDFEEEPGSEGENNHDNPRDEPQVPTLSIRANGSRLENDRDAAEGQTAQAETSRTGKALSLGAGNKAVVSQAKDTETSSKSRRRGGREGVSNGAPADAPLKPVLKGRKGASAARKSTAQADVSTWTTLAVAEDDASADGEGGATQPSEGRAASLSQQELRRRAFAGDEVDATFEAEKEEMAADEGDQVIDSTLPGWGHWIGDGVRKGAAHGQKRKYLTKVEGVKREKRADAKLPNVIMSEKRMKKNATYMSPTLPYPFETREQYERSLRLPVGPEWTTKQTFQAATKPRVLLKQGVIAPLQNPFV